jgi:hypothetical protein
MGTETGTETYCILHLTSFSTGIGLIGQHIRIELSDIGTESNLIDLVCFEDILQDLVVCNKFVFVSCVHFHPIHWDIIYRRKNEQQRMDKKRETYCKSNQESDNRHPRFHIVRPSYS